MSIRGIAAGVTLLGAGVGAGVVISNPEAVENLLHNPPSVTAETATAIGGVAANAAATETFVPTPVVISANTAAPELHTGAAPTTAAESQQYMERLGQLVPGSIDANGNYTNPAQTINQLFGPPSENTSGEAPNPSGATCYGLEGQVCDAFGEWSRSTGITDQQAWVDQGLNSEDPTVRAQATYAASHTYYPNGQQSGQ